MHLDLAFQPLYHSQRALTINMQLRAKPVAAGNNETKLFLGR